MCLPKVYYTPTHTAIHTNTIMLIDNRSMGSNTITTFTFHVMNNGILKYYFIPYDILIIFRNVLTYYYYMAIWEYT